MKGKAYSKENSKQRCDISVIIVFLYIALGWLYVIIYNRMLYLRRS